MIKPTTFVDIKSLNTFAFHLFVNTSPKDLSCGVIKGHRIYIYVGL